MHQVGILQQRKSLWLNLLNLKKIMTYVIYGMIQLNFEKHCREVFC